MASSTEDSSLRQERNWHLSLPEDFRVALSLLRKLLGMNLQHTSTFVTYSFIIYIATSTMLRITDIQNNYRTSSPVIGFQQGDGCGTLAYCLMEQDHGACVC